MDAVMCILDDMLWPYFPFFQVESYSDLGLQASEDIRPLLSLCTHLRARAIAFASTLIEGRRAERLRLLNQIFPTFAYDRAMYGEPIVFWPCPMWRRWKVQEWWYVSRSRNVREWILGETHWLASLLDLEVLNNERNFGGTFLHRRYYLSSFTWEYDPYERSCWCEEYHM